MTNQECSHQLHQIKFTAGMNLRYHQYKESVWTHWDSILKILVGILAVASAMLSVATDVPKEWSIGLGILSAVAAIALNVIPLGDWAKFYGEMFRSWNGLYAECDMLKRHVDGRKEDGAIGADVGYWLDHLCHRENDLHSREPAPNEKLLKKCEAAERMAVFGFTSAEEIETERVKRLSACSE